MKRFLTIILLSVVIISQSQTNTTNGLVYLKIKTEFAVFPGIKDFETFTKAYPQFNTIINENNITDIKCIFKTMSKNIQSIYYINISENTDAKSIIDELEKISIVEYAELPIKYNVSSVNLTTNDPRNSETWHLEKIKAHQSWDIYSGGTGYKTKIAIIDAGFVLNHSDLANNFWKNTAEIPNDGIDNDNNGFIDDYDGWDCADDDNDPNLSAQETDDTYGHGTFVCGFAGAVTDNNIGIASVSFNNVEIIPIKVARNNFVGAIELPDGALPYAMDYAIKNNAEIISMSLSSQSTDWGYSGGKTIHEFIIEANNQNIILLAATGNYALYGGYEEISYPARFPEVIAVGSTDQYDLKSDFSQYSQSGTEVGVDIVSPGEQVYSTETGAYVGAINGTSFSTPTVAGALGLMKSFQPTATVEQLKQCLFSGADNIDTIQGNINYISKNGYGRLNVYNSISCLDSIFNVTENIIINNNNNQVILYPNPVKNTLLLSINNNKLGNTIDISIIDISGKKIKTFNLANSNILHLDISEMKKGSYFIVIKGNTIIRKKFIKY